MSAAPHQPDPLHRPKDLVGGPMLASGPDASRMGEDPGASRSGRSSSNFDTIVGRLVIDQGLATPEELQRCLDLARGGQGPGGRGGGGGGGGLAAEVGSAGGLGQPSVAELLVANEYITRRQLERLREAAEAERSGQQIPGYKLVGVLGAGAMAKVYKAKQLSLDRMVAIKVLPRKFTQSPQFIERFYAEGRAAAQLNHPNIVQAFDVGKAGEYHYFVMEYVEGRTVHDDIVARKRFNDLDAVDIVIQTAEALVHAHEKGLIHRDVKPKNVMITTQGVVKLADMGLARAISDKEAAEAEAGKAFGTPYYISPEQIRGEVKIGPPADIYSLGATLYHMVTGAVPFDGKSPSDVMHKHLKAELVPPDQANPKVSPRVAEVIEMMMAKDPRKRYQSCRDLIGDLKAVRRGQDPPMAHRDLGGLDLASLAKAEAAAPAQIAENKAVALDKGVNIYLFVSVLVLAVIAVVMHVVRSI